jgi:hypothetical protein
VTFTTSTTATSYTFAAKDGSASGSSATITTVASTSTPTIGRISPTSATNGGSQTVEITGTNFAGNPVVTLTKSGYSTITSTVYGTDSPTILRRTFALSGVTAGAWTLVVTNPDGGTTSTSFTVSSATAATVTAISPVSGIANATVPVTITGTGFTAANARMRLYNGGNYIIGSLNTGGSTTQLTGSFDLDDATPATYSVCVLADGSDASKVCGPTFVVYAENAVNGTVYFTSSPSGAKVWFDSVYKDTTPFTLDNVIPGTHTVKMQRTSYVDWSQSITVTAGKQTTVNAYLTLPTSTVTTKPTTVAVTTATLPPTTVKSTIAVATPWPTYVAEEESPVEIAVIAGALLIGIIVLRKKE